MRTISVKLSEITIKHLDSIMNSNDCTISDAVNAAIISYSLDKQPSMITNKKPLQDLIKKLKEVHPGETLEDWCTRNNIIKSRLIYLINRVARGGGVCGFGNTKNKWRDKQDGRLYKTHTAWIATCLKDDLGINLF